jgi:hypothetical protein
MSVSLRRTSRTARRGFGHFAKFAIGFYRRHCIARRFAATAKQGNCLTASVDALDAKRSELETDLKAAESAELRADIIRQLAEAAAAANSHSEYIQVTDELDGILKEKSGELLDLIAVVIENGKNFANFTYKLCRRTKKPFQFPAQTFTRRPKF